MLIPTNTDRIVELNPAVRCRWRIKFMYAKLFERLPVFYHHVGVHQRSLDVQFEIRLLLFRHLRHQIRIIML